MGGDTRRRTTPEADAGGRGDRSRAGGDGRLCRSRLALFVGHSAGVADLAGTAAEHCHLGVVERAVIRRAALLHDLGRVAVAARVWRSARSAVSGRMGAGEAAPVPHRAGALALGLPSRARSDRRGPPRTTGRLGLLPRRDRRGAHSGGTPACRRRRLPRDDRAPAAPRGALAGARGERARRGGPAGAARRRRCRRGARGGGPTGARIERPAG